MVHALLLRPHCVPHPLTPPNKPRARAPRSNRCNVCERRGWWLVYLSKRLVVGVFIKEIGRSRAGRWVSVSRCMFFLGAGCRTGCRRLRASRRRA
eukprot:4956799-Pleurochrysis_carterae.AAC.1